MTHHVSILRIPQEASKRQMTMVGGFVDTCNHIHPNALRV